MRLASVRSRMHRCAWTASAAKNAPVDLKADQVSGDSTDARTDPEDGSPARRRESGYLLLALIAAGVVALDQITKQLAINGLSDGPIDVIDGVFRLRLAFNSGGAFGVLQGLPGFFLIATIVVVCLIVFWVRNLDDPRSIAPLGLILGGGLGNLADRVLRDFNGNVVDFLDFHIWPVFNLADSAIVIGVLATFWFSFRAERDPGS
jgi:signal peptidase II